MILGCIEKQGLQVIESVFIVTAPKLIAVKLLSL
jgi:hypothetical protein